MGVGCLTAPGLDLAPTPGQLAGTVVATVKRHLLSGCRLDDGRICGHDDELAALDAPREAGVIVLGRRPLAITAKEVEGTPAKPLGVGCPSLVEKSATVIDELRPSLRGDVRRHPAGVKPGHCFGPRPPHTTIMFHDGRTFLLRIGPNSILVLGLNFRYFRWFR